MTPDDFVASLPEEPCPARDDMVLAAVRSGTLTPEWTEVISESRGHRCRIPVTADAVGVTLSNGTRFRVMVSARLLQRMADLMGALLPTSRVCDLAFGQATVGLDACPQGASPQMASMTVARAYNAAVEAKRKGRAGLVRDCGKTWILSRLSLQRRDAATNYGFYSPAGRYLSHSGEKMWQPKANAHNFLHEDYSQTAQLMSRICFLDGNECDITDLMADSSYSELISDEGPLTFSRQPGVEVET